MRLLRLDIQQLPGIAPGFTVTDISPGINLVTGPNASGKSSLIRALRYLVSEPDSSDPAALSLSAAFEDRDTRWTVVRTGQQQQWQRDGQAAERPPLPDATALHCYWLTMEDLAVAGRGDTELVAALRRALTGGYDLRGLRQSLFPEAPRAGQAERRKLREARGELRNIETEYETLRDLERELPELSEQVDRASMAGRRAALLEQALTLATVLAERRGVDETLGRFPRIMDALRGNEAEQMDRLETRLAELRASEEKLRPRLAACEEQWKDTGLSTASPADHELEATRSRLEELRRWQQRLDELEAALEQSGRAEQQARLALTGEKGGAAATDLPVPRPDHLTRAERLVDRLERNRVAMAQIHAPGVDDEAGSPDEESIRRCWQGVDALEKWQAARVVRAVQRKSRPGLLLAASAVLVSLVLSATEQNWWVLVASAAGLCSILWSLYVQLGNPEADARDRFRNLALCPPDDWSPEAVRARLETLRREVNDRERRRLRELEERREQQRREVLREEARELAGEREALAEELGFDPTWEGAGIQRHLQLVARHEQARQQRRDQQVEKERLQRRIDEAREAVVAFLGRWQPDGQQADLHDLEAAYQAVRQRAQTADEAERSIRELRSRLEENREQQTARQAERDDLYRAVGLEPGNRGALDEALEQLSRWRSLQKERQELQGREREPRSRLADHPELVRLAETGQRETLENELDDCLLQAGEREALRDRRSDIRGRLQSAGQDRRLEKALHQVDQEESALQDRLRSRLSAQAGRFLLDEIEEEHHSEHEPEVLSEARDLFGRFTHQAWDIVVGESQLLARDRRLEELRPLSALSSGTRMQLLLAVRLAWTRRIERGCLALPLFLDEALTTSDEARFAEVADSLEILSRDEGRQVFYLSARVREQALWKQVTGTVPHHIDLEALRFGQTGARAEDYHVPPEQPVPAPGDASPEQYAERLGVAPVDPLRPPGDLPVFHLLRDDLSLLYHLMADWRIRSMGQLEGLLGSHSAEVAIPDAGTRNRLVGRCAVARQWHRAWGRGRDRSVDDVVLQESEAVSDRFLPEIGKRARQEQGDPRALIAALEDRERKVPGFGPARVSALEEWLEQQGYITPGEPLTREQRQQQVLHELGRRHDPRDTGVLLGWLEAGLPASD